MQDDRQIEKILMEAVANQQEKILKTAEFFMPNVSQEDLLQPFDFPILDQNPNFRHEEGILEGLQTALAAVRAFHHKIR